MHTLERTRGDCLRELNAIDREIASAERQLLTSTNTNTITVSEAKLPSLQRKRDALLVELPELPEDRPRVDPLANVIARMDAAIAARRARGVPDPVFVPEDPEDPWAIPSFLRRPLPPRRAA